MSQPSARLRLLRLAAMIVVILVGAIALSVYWTNSRQMPTELSGQGKNAELQQSTDYPDHVIQKPDLPSNDFVGSAACSECHPEIVQAYRSRPMANSLWKTSSASLVEDYSEDVSFTPDDRHHYSVEKTSKAVFHHERLTDDKGQTLYDQAVRVDYAVGSGAQGRSYLIDRGGILFMSPISWYSSARRWDLSPGYELPFHRRFDRRIQDGCLDCHAGRLNSERGLDNRFGKPPFLELSIGCERCHGPGGGHIKYQNAEHAADDEDPIVNPARLDPARREDVCTQCHLQGEGRVPHYGHEVGDFRPGQRLEETCVLFVEGARVTPDGTTRAVSQVEQMRVSVCFRESNGRLGCISCHDVHSPPTESEMFHVYREKCLKCHQDQGCSLPETERLRRQPNDSCASCHMPRLGGSDVPHTSHTDHRILRKPTPRSRTRKSSGVLPEVFDNADTRLPRLTVDRARGLWLADRAEQKTDTVLAAGAIRLLSAVAQRLPDDADVLDALGTASAVSGSLDDSLTYWKQALTIEPDREKTLRTMALLLHNTGRTEAALPYLQKYLQLQPWDASMWGRYSHILGQSGQWERAVEAARKSEELNPSESRVYQWLSEAYKQVGDEQQSRHYADLFKRMKRRAVR